MNNFSYIIKVGLCLLALQISAIACFAQTNLYKVHQSEVAFSSEAPKELIKASTDNLEGILDIQKKTFAFKVAIISFMGFNSPLQRGHFNENYLESEKFPFAYFTGKIIEDYDLGKNGMYTIRAKGKLTIHGIAQEKIISVRLEVKNKKIDAHSDFSVMLDDYGIKIPRIVNDKLASEIKVLVTASFIAYKN